MTNRKALFYCIKYINAHIRIIQLGSVYARSILALTDTFTV